MELYQAKFNNKPDKDYEYFWLTIKTIILKYSDIDMTEKINSLSTKLNILQKEEKYIDIAENINIFLSNNMFYLCKLIILTKNPEYIHRFTVNMKKWFAIMNDRKFNLAIELNDQFFADLMFVLNLYTDSDKFTVLINLIYDILNTISTSNKNIDKHMNKIFVFSIVNKYTSMAEFMKNHIDLKQYFSDTNEYSKNKNTRGVKLCTIISKHNTDYYQYILTTLG